jgi:histidine triad (HIT) family protein
MDVFCAIARGEAPAAIVYQDDRALAFMDIRPIQPCHTLVIPRQHAALMKELDDDLMAHVWSVVMKVYRAIRAGDIPHDAVNVLVADGAAAGQEVAHVHVHLIPRSANDGFGLRLPPGGRAQPDRAELERTASLIRAALPQDTKRNSR